MHLELALLAAVVALAALATQAMTAQPSHSDMCTAAAWTETNLKPDASPPPFSFVYDGKPSSEVLKSWKSHVVVNKLDDARRQRVITLTDPNTALELRCVAILYRNFPTVEWTLYFSNTGDHNTPIIEQIQPLDTTLRRGNAREFLLHHSKGTPSDGSDYQPFETQLWPNAKKQLGGAGGRPTQKDMSYFNLEWDGKGMIVVVGWPGQWAADLVRDGSDGLRIRAGQELTRFTLYPGEEVRTPLILLQFWSGDWIRSQNLWRRWMMAHGMPRPGGKLPKPMLFGSSCRFFNEMEDANEQIQTTFIDRYCEEKINIDYWWMDAGWYPLYGGNWAMTGTWEPDKTRFPRGLRAVSDHARDRGIKTLLWFEPERVAPGTWLYNNHKDDWLLEDILLNLGNPEAWNWLVNHIDKLITDEGVDLYRQDHNIDPLPYWRNNDAEDRQGITEIKYVTGYLAYWDELTRRHPNMLIDSCASGGRRNDLETMRRSVPLWRSDFAFRSTGTQCITYGVSLWLPYHGTGTVAVTDAPYHGTVEGPINPYAFWSNAAPGLGLTFDVRDENLDYPAIRTLIAQWRTVAPYYFADYYPITPYTNSASAWIAWQFHRPDLNHGMVQAFRRPGCLKHAASYPLYAIDPAADYLVADIDAESPRRISGQNLMNDGLKIDIPNKPGVAVITYRNIGVTS